MSNRKCAFHGVTPVDFLSIMFIVILIGHFYTIFEALQLCAYGEYDFIVSRKGGDVEMMGLEEIRNDLELINEIDWDMTPEEAVILYLEWGNNWSHGSFVRSKHDASYYFVINSWSDPPTIYLIKRNSEEAVELAGFHMPEEIKDRFLESIAYKKGVYALNEEVRAWLEKELSV